jgi:hypothetical protein
VEPVPARLRNLGRVNRLRWLTGKRSPDENWDAFEALNGRPFLELIGTPPPWREVRYWLYDLATEISAAEKDGTLPELSLDRVWITAEGRAKLLDFPAPGLASPVSHPPPTFNPAAPPPPALCNPFLNAIAAAALTGHPVGSAQTVGDVAVPLPLHARTVLKSLSRMAGAEAVAAALKPLLNRVATVSRVRRAAIVGGCILFPVLASVAGLFGLTFVHELAQKNPGLMDLSTLLQMRASARFWGGKEAQSPSVAGPTNVFVTQTVVKTRVPLPTVASPNPVSVELNKFSGGKLPTDRQIAIYIAHHYSGLITNQTSWSSYMVLGMIKGEARKFAEQSVAEHPAPTPEEIKEADAAVDKHLPKDNPFEGQLPSWMPAFVMLVCLLVYVCLPAMIATLLFRGGLVLLIAGVTFVRKDGQRASRLRLFWRAMVAWSPSFVAFFLSFLAISKHLAWMPWLALGIVGLLAAVSIALPDRGLQDRLAGTWLVPR